MAEGEVGQLTKQRFADPVAHAQAYALIFGLIAYGLLYAAYSAFYSTVGLSVADAGLGYTDVLTHSSGAMSLFGIIVICYLLFPSVRILINIAIFTILFVVLLSAAVHRHFTEPMYVKAITKPVIDRQEELRDGKAVEPVSLFGITLIDLRATPTRMHWNKSTTAVYSPLADPTVGSCTLYLGQSNGEIVSYDPPARRVVRVPVADVLLSLRESVPSCATSDFPVASSHTPTRVVLIGLDGRQYQVLVERRYLSTFPALVTQAVREGATNTFSQPDGSRITISFRGVRVAQTRVLETSKPFSDY